MGRFERAVYSVCTACIYGVSGFKNKNRQHSSQIALGRIAVCDPRCHLNYRICSVTFATLDNKRCPITQGLRRPYCRLLKSGFRLQLAGVLSRRGRAGLSPYPCSLCQPDRRYFSRSVLLRADKNTALILLLLPHGRAFVNRPTAILPKKPPPSARLRLPRPACCRGRPPRSTGCRW